MVISFYSSNIPSKNKISQHITLTAKALTIYKRHLGLIDSGC